jgi:hypothetical protein
MKSRNAAIYSGPLLLSRPLARRLLRVKMIIGWHGLAVVITARLAARRLAPRGLLQSLR